MRRNVTLMALLVLFLIGAGGPSFAEQVFDPQNMTSDQKRELIKRAFQIEFGGLISSGSSQIAQLKAKGGGSAAYRDFTLFGDISGMFLNATEVQQNRRTGKLELDYKLENPYYIFLEIAALQDKPAGTQYKIDDALGFGIDYGSSWTDTGIAVSRIVEILPSGREIESTQYSFYLGGKTAVDSIAFEGEVYLARRVTGRAVASFIVPLKDGMSVRLTSEATFDSRPAAGLKRMTVVTMPTVVMAF